MIAWAFSPFVPILVIAAYLLPGTAPGMALYSALSLGLLAIIFLYMLLGVIAYRKHPVLWPVYVVLTPIAVLVHAVGALWGVVRPVEEFEVTEKVSADRIEAVNSDLEAGELSRHDGTERLVRDSADEFEDELF